MKASQWQEDYYQEWWKTPDCNQCFYCWYYHPVGKRCQSCHQTLEISSIKHGQGFKHLICCCSGPGTVPTFASCCCVLALPQFRIALGMYGRHHLMCSALWPGYVEDHLIILTMYINQVMHKQCDGCWVRYMAYRLHVASSFCSVSLPVIYHV